MIPEAGLASLLAAVDPGTVLVLAGIAFLGSFIYGVTGFGAGLITIPLASNLYEMRFVLAVYALLDLVNVVRVMLSQPRAVVREEAVRLVPTCVLGVVAGAALVLVLKPWILMLALGLFVLAYAVYSLAMGRRLPMVSMRWSYVAGVTGGVTSAMFGAGGPPYAVYLSMRPHDKEQTRATLAVTSLVSIGLRVVVFGIAGLLSPAPVWMTALCILPATLLALWLAERVHRAISREAVMTAIRVLLVLAGGSLVLRALMAAG